MILPGWMYNEDNGTWTHINFCEPAGTILFRALMKLKEAHPEAFEVPQLKKKKGKGKKKA